MKLNPLHCTDFYKVGHKDQYPKGTEYIYSNFTPRSSINGEKYVIWFGLQYFIKSFLIESFNEYFFNADKDKVLHTYKSRIDKSLGGDLNIDHLAKLHDLGYLPLLIRALPEGSKVSLKIPVLTVRNTLPEFYWLTNYIETALSNYLWKMTTSATTAYSYRRLLEKYAHLNGDIAFVPFQAHDFSCRGMSGMEDAAMSGAGHLTCFKGTDSIVAIDLIEQYYNSFDDIGYSIPATEHSVMCAGGKNNEFETFKRLITEVYPEGNVSIVSDTWNLWTVLEDYIPRLFDVLEKRKGKVIIRPDSGDPVEITTRVCELISTFPESIYDKLGVIYGDSITLDRCEQILKNLLGAGCRCDNVAFGVGSYTYQYKTRDNLGFAVKSTWAQINREFKELFKDPITDNGIKKSAKGILTVLKDKHNNYYLKDQQDKSVEFHSYLNNGELKTVFDKGVLYHMESIYDIRNRIETNLAKEE